MSDGGATESRAGSGIWPYVLPYLAFGAVLALADRAGENAAPALLLAQVALPMAALAFFLWRGDFPELSGWRPTLTGGMADVALGLAVAAVWLLPYLAFEALPRPGPEAGFDSTLLGSEPATLAVRLVGFALVTPFMEELFVRSFLLRMIDAFDPDADFRDLPIGRFAWRSFVGTVVWFTVTHQTWEWIVALPTGIVLNLWLYRRRQIGSTVLAHASANAAIFAFVLLRAPARPDLWIFL